MIEFSNRNGVQVVVKTTTKNLAVAEIKALQALKIPNISELIHIIDGKVPVLVFRRYEQFKTKKLDLVDLSIHMKQLAQILCDVHLRGYCHLDISPANLMLQGNQLILIDFAFVRKVGEEHSIGCGTSGYIAPEVYSSTKSITASDIYSMGVVLGQFLDIYVPNLSLHYLGSKLLMHPTTTYICDKIKNLLTNAQYSGLPKILIDAADLLHRMLQFEPGYRISAQEMLEHSFLNAPPSDFKEFDYETHSRHLMLNPTGRKQGSGPIMFTRG